MADAHAHDDEFVIMDLIENSAVPLAASEVGRPHSSKARPNKPTPRLVEDLNDFLRGWSNCFDYGYPRKAFRDLSHYTRQRMVTHLHRRSQRKYHRP